MKRIDAEIFEVERRLHRREASIKHDARELKGRSVKALMSPVSIVAAVALGFLVAGGAGRRKSKADAPSKQTKEQSKGFAFGGVLMAVATWFIKNQFGGPVGLARFVISKIRKDENRGPPPALRTGV